MNRFAAPTLADEMTACVDCDAHLHFERVDEEGRCEECRCNAQEEEPKRMWTPPAGWWKAAQAARQEIADRAFQDADNQRRREHGLPTYDGKETIQ